MQAGDPAPDWKLEAAVSGRAVDKAGLAGRRVVLVFHGPRTTDAPKEVGKAVRAEHADAADVFVANVINLKSMGGLWKKVATAQVNQTYEKMAAKLEAKGMDPVEYVVLCPDWENAVAPAFGVEDSNQEAAAAVIEDDGTVLGVVSGDDLSSGVLKLLG